MRAMEKSANSKRSGVPPARTLPDSRRRDHQTRSLSLYATAPQQLFEAGLDLHLAGRLGEADRHYRGALAADPAHADSLHLLGLTLHQVGRQTVGLPLMRRALSLRPLESSMWSNLGDALRSNNQIEQGAAAMKRALILEPAQANATHNLGMVQHHLGQAGEARRLVDRAITIDPNSATFYYTLVDLMRLSDPADPRLAAMEALTHSLPDTALNDLTSLHFALGVAYKDLGQDDRALEHFILGNRFKRRMHGYNEAATLTLFDQLADAYPAERFAGLPPGEPAHTGPIFVLGMPRSGTSLIEQILASHSAVFGAGELTLLEETILAHLPPGGFLQSVPGLPTAELKQIGDIYRTALQALAPPGTRRIVDKMPFNFMHCGAIALMLPDAKIVHIKRDPIDTCLSCFSTHFAGGHAYTQDLGDLGRLYRAYEKLMEHWRRVLPPGIMIELTYEEVVADLEGKMRPVLDLCGLEWEENCLHFHRTRRAVVTASQSQVRQPLFKSRTSSWRPSNALLKPLLDALDGR